MGTVHIICAYCGSFEISICLPEVWVLLCLSNDIVVACLFVNWNYTELLKVRTCASENVSILKQAFKA